MKIDKLKISTENLEQQYNFYKNILNLPVEKTDKNTLFVSLGFSDLILRESEDFKPYHIAFHISALKQEPALLWLKERLEILKAGEQEIIDFKNWNAKSIYFYDADQNIIEFISRKHLFDSEESGFSEKDIIGISEVGLAVKNVKNTYEQIHQKTGLKKYFGDFEKFCVIGEDKGLLITVNQNEKTWFPTKDKSENAAFELDFQYDHKLFKMMYDGKQLFIDQIKKP